MKNYLKIIDSLLRKSAEEECYELKENWYEPHAIGEYISALSNAAALQHKEYAYMLWGIREEGNKVVGTTFDFRKSTKQEPLEHYLARQLNPDTNFSFHEITYQKNRLVLLDSVDVR